jgi:hypothetical protein
MITTYRSQFRMRRKRSNGLGAIKEANGAAMSIGRISTFLYVYIERGLKAGILDEARAQELWDQLVQKLRIVRFLRTSDYDALFSGDPYWATECVGGMDLDGRALVTKSSYRMLHTLHNLWLAPEPNITVLWPIQSGLRQRDPDPAPVGRKFQAGLEPLKRDDHAFLVSQLHAAEAADQRTAGANGVIDTGKVLQFTQSRNASGQPHGRGADRDAEAEAGNLERIVSTTIRQHTASAAGTHNQACLGEYHADRARRLCVGWHRQSGRDSQDQHGKSQRMLKHRDSSREFFKDEMH